MLRTDSVVAAVSPAFARPRFMLVPVTYNNCPSNLGGKQLKLDNLNKEWNQNSDKKQGKWQGSHRLKQ